MTTLREAAQQALEALEAFLSDELRPHEAAKISAALRAALAQQAEPNISRCPQCNGPADNGFDRSIPPNPYLCTKCIAEPVEPVEPVAWMFESERNFNLVGYGGWEKRITECRPNALQSSVRNVTPLYTAPPQRKLVPLTEEEIEACRQQGYAHAGLGAPFDFGKAARAVERAHGIKEN